MTRVQIYGINLICLVFSIVMSAQEIKRERQRGYLIDQKVFLVVLGTVQDAGSPHIACNKECCATLFEDENYSRKVVSLGLVDQINYSHYLFEAT